MVEEKMLIIGELNEGKELATQLKQLDPVISREACLDLVDKIVSTYDKALSSVFNLTSGLKRQQEQAQAAATTDVQLVQAFHQSSDVHTNSKKRKTVASWNEQMRVCSADTGGTGGGGGESTKDDGQYRWRKYGQKHILGAKFPRAYYRCTHRTTQGCLATKKVQKTDNNSSSFQIYYKGHHTCIPLPPLVNSIPPPPSTTKNYQKKKKSPHVQTPSESENNDTKEQVMFNSISFTPPTTIESIENHHEFFSSILLDDDVNYSPAFLSPTTTTSDSDYFPFDWQQLNNNYGSLQSSDHLTADMNMILTPTSGSDGFFDFDDTTTTFLNQTLGYFT